MELEQMNCLECSYFFHECVQTILQNYLKTPHQLLWLLILHINNVSPTIVRFCKYKRIHVSHNFYFLYFIFSYIKVSLNSLQELIKINFTGKETVTGDTRTAV
jgi:hypothetical protein